jgi:hypothetical protein
MQLLPELAPQNTDLLMLVHAPLVEVEEHVEMKIDDVPVNTSQPSIELIERRGRHGIIIADALTDGGRCHWRSLRCPWHS